MNDPPLEDLSRNQSGRRYPVGETQAKWSNGIGSKLLGVVALTEDLPHCGLVRGQVGAVVETRPPDTFEVEFCDNDGRTYAMLALTASQLMLLHHEPVEAT